MGKISNEAHAAEMKARRARQHARAPGFTIVPSVGGVPTGRNHSTGRFSRIRTKWMVAPTAAQKRPARHTHPRRRRAA